MAIEIDDPYLAQSPEGCFYLAVAAAIDELGIEPINGIRVTDIAIGPPKRGSEIVICALPETPVDRPKLGKYCVNLSARVIEHESFDVTRRHPLGWRLLQRSRMLRRLGGQGTLGSGLTYLSYCYTLMKPGYGPLLDDQSRQRGLARSEIIVNAEYCGT